MSDDEVDTELLELLRQSLGITNAPSDELSADTGVLRDAEFIYNNAIDVFIDMWSTKSAARQVWKIMQERNWSVKAWSEHELHPSLTEGFDEVGLLNFVFTMDLLNFSFWSEAKEQDRFQIDYQGKRWTGYMSLVASLRRALDEGIPITTPRFWRSQECTNGVIEHVFRSATAEQMPLLADRISILREAGRILQSYDDAPQQESWIMEQTQPETQLGAVLNPTADPTAQEVAAHDTTIANVAITKDANDPINVADDHVDSDAVSKADNSPLKNDTQAVPEHARSAFDMQLDCSVQKLVEKAEHSAGKLVNLIVKEFPSFEDTARYEGRRVRLLKRAQIFVADLYGAFQGEGLGYLPDIGHLTMFADYRVPQILHSLGILSYCPALDAHIRRGDLLPPQSSWEVQLRGCSIYATELLRREITRIDEDAKDVNAVLIDFLLYDLAKEKEVQAIEGSMLHHRTRSTNY